MTFPISNNHPITPPPELVQQWDNDWHRAKIKHTSLSTHVATAAARWGADQELQACCEWVGDGRRENLSQVIALRAARRPEPPISREAALAVLDDISHRLDSAQENLLRRVLEALPNG